MTRLYSTGQHNILPHLFLALCLLLTTAGCDNVDATPDIGATESTMEFPELTIDDIEFTNTSPVMNKSGETEYQLEIGLRPAPWRSRLRGLHMIPGAKDAQPVLLVDDGSGSDIKPGDGVYSARIPGNCVPVTGREQSETAAAKDIDIDCTINFVGPGEQCGKWHECPSRVRREILWGLITYETDIVVCFCIEKCTISK